MQRRHPAVFLATILFHGAFFSIVYWGLGYRSRTRHEPMFSAANMRAARQTLPSISDSGKWNDPVLQMLVNVIEQGDDHAQNARIPLEDWNSNRIFNFSNIESRFVKTRDGTRAELVILMASTMSMPGQEFAMGLLLVEGKAVDWKAYGTSSRVARPELKLLDVNRDGFVDLVARFRPGFWRSGDMTGYAFSIQSDGFQEIRDYHPTAIEPTVDFDAGQFPVDLSVAGFPRTVNDFQNVVCTISARNTSDRPIEIGHRKWLEVDVDGCGGYGWRVLQQDRVEWLPPAATITTKIRLELDDFHEDRSCAIHWLFIPVKPR